MASWLCPHVCFFDSVSRYRVLVDTGIPISLWPARVAAGSPSKLDICLAGPSSARVRTFGTSVRRISLSPGAATFCVTFRMAEVDIPVLGADFLRNTNLVLDVGDRSMARSSPPPRNRTWPVYRMPDHVLHTTVVPFTTNCCSRVVCRCTSACFYLLSAPPLALRPVD